MRFWRPAELTETQRLHAILDVDVDVSDDDDRSKQKHNRCASTKKWTRKGHNLCRVKHLTRSDRSQFSAVSDCTKSLLVGDDRQMNKRFGYGAADRNIWACAGVRVGRTCVQWSRRLWSFFLCTSLGDGIYCGSPACGVPAASSLAVRGWPVRFRKPRQFLARP